MQNSFRYVRLRIKLLYHAPAVLSIAIVNSRVTLLFYSFDFRIYMKFLTIQAEYAMMMMERDKLEVL